MTSATGHQGIVREVHIVWRVVSGHPGISAKLKLKFAIES